jgi:hypothetical protein
MTPRNVIIIPLSLLCALTVHNEKMESGRQFMEKLTTALNITY